MSIGGVKREGIWHTRFLALERAADSLFFMRRFLFCSELSSPSSRGGASLSLHRSGLYRELQAWSCGGGSMLILSGKLFLESDLEARLRTVAGGGLGKAAMNDSTVDKWREEGW